MMVRGWRVMFARTVVQLWASRPYGNPLIGPQLEPLQIGQMNWRSIRLELGQTGEFPAGSVSRAYLIRLPLNDGDHVDVDAVMKSPSKATVRRHWSTEPDQLGVMIRYGEDWAMRCPKTADRVLQLDGTPVRLGQQVSIKEPDGTVLPFKITSIR